MRITRSGLRRIIAEESTRILAEAHERVPGGHQMRIAAGFEDEPAEEDWDDEEEEEEEDDYTYGDDPEEFLDLPGGEIQQRLRDIDEGEGKKHHMSPRQRLTAYLEAVGAGGVVDTVMAAIDAAVARAEQEGADVTSEDVTFNLSNEDLDAIPRGHAVRWHNMLNAVLDDEIDPEAFADAEAHRRDIEDTERDLSRPSNFLEEGEGGDYDYDYEDEPEAEMGDPEDPYGDLPKGARPRGGLVHTAGFKGGSPAGALLRRRGGEDLSEARWAKLAGVLED